jgi:molybdopterin synthase catalytic subunit
MSGFSVSAVPLDVPALRAALQNPAHGGFCAFEGWVRNRNDGRAVEGLEYEIYTRLAQVEGDAILAEARERFGDIDAIGVHRSGMLAVGDLAVWVGVSSAHRDAAFRACRYIIDAFKHRLPVWKKERYADGDAHWVVCSHGSDPHSSASHAPERDSRR